MRSQVFLILISLSIVAGCTKANTDVFFLDSSSSGRNGGPSSGTGHTPAQGTLPLGGSQIVSITTGLPSMPSPLASGFRIRSRLQFLQTQTSNGSSVLYRVRGTVRFE